MRWMDRLSVRTKLVGLILLVILPMFATQVLQLQGHLREYSSAELALEGNYAEEVGMVVRNYLSRVWSLKGGLGRALLSNPRMDDAEVREMLLAQMDEERLTSALGWISPEGRLIAHTLGPAFLPEVTEYQLVQRALRGEKKVLGTVANCSPTGADCLLAILRIEREGGELFGLIASLITFDRLDQELNDLVKAPRSFVLVDEDGRATYSSQLGGISAGDHASNHYPVSMLRKNETYESRGFQPTAESPISMVGAVLVSQGWSVWVSTPESEALLIARRSLQQSWITLLVMTSVSVVGALVVAERMLRQAGQLRHAALAVSLGDRSARAAVSERDELGEAILAFDRMLERLTEQEQAARTESVAIQKRLSFLADAGAELVSSLEYEPTLQRIADLAVPSIADWCAIRLADGEKYSVVAVRHVDPTVTEHGWQLLRRQSPAPSGFWNWRQVLETGESTFHSTVTEDMLAEQASSPKHLEELRQIGYTSVIVVPMQSQSGIIGTITLITAESGRVYTERDLGLAKEMARYAALAVERAKLYHRSQEALAERDRALAHAQLVGRHQQVIAELGRKALSVTGDPAQLLNETLRILAEELHVEYASVMELMPGRPALKMRAAYGWDRHLVGNLVLYQEPQTQAGYTLMMDEPVVSEDLREESRFLVPDLISTHAIRSCASVSIRSSQQVAYGVLIVHSKQRRSFGAEEISFLGAVANLMGAAMSRWQMEAALQEEEAIVSGQARVLELIATGGELGDVLQAVLNFVEERIHHTRCYIELTVPVHEKRISGERYRREQSARTLVDLAGTDRTTAAGEIANLLGEPVAATDMVGDAPWTASPEVLSDRPTWWSRRIFGPDGSVLGILHVHSEMRRRTTPEEQKVLDVSVSLIGVAIEQRRVQEERNQKLEYLIKHMDEGVIATDEQGRILTFSPSLYRLIGAELKIQPEGLPIEEVGLPGPLVEAIRQSLTPADSAPEQIVLKHADSEFLVQLRGVQPGLGQTIGSIALIRDVTREQRLERLERSLIANVSHELRGPLATLSATAEAMFDGLITDEMRPKYLKAMVDEMSRLRRLTSDLLELSRLEAGILHLALAPVDVAELCQALHAKWGQRCARSGLDLKVDCHSVTLTTDYDRLEQILANFLENAVRHTGPGGQVKIVGRGERGGVCLSVTDSGEGISKEHLNRIWDRFYKVDSARTLRADRGSGLGLAIAKQLADHLDGELLVESELGKGSTFSLWLPIG